ncbi:hypothetical protein Tco_0391129 [Tanacetum coccineum]
MEIGAAFSLFEASAFFAVFAYSPLLGPCLSSLIRCDICRDLTASSVGGDIRPCYVPYLRGIRRTCFYFWFPLVLSLGAVLGILQLPLLEYLWHFNEGGKPVMPLT